MDPHERPLGMADGIALLRASAAVRVMAEGMDPLQAHDSDFNDLLGAHVKIVGLKSKPELNGVVGRCMSWDENLGRAGVKLPGREQMLSVKASNLEKLAAPPVLDTDTEFNGQTEHSREAIYLRPLDIHGNWLEVEGASESQRRWGGLHVTLCSFAPQPGIGAPLPHGRSIVDALDSAAAAASAAGGSSSWRLSRARIYRGGVSLPRDEPTLVAICNAVAAAGLLKARAVTSLHCSCGEGHEEAVLQALLNCTRWELCIASCSRNVSPLCVSGITERRELVGRGPICSDGSTSGLLLSVRIADCTISWHFGEEEDEVRASLLPPVAAGSEQQHIALRTRPADGGGTLGTGGRVWNSAPMLCRWLGEHMRTLIAFSSRHGRRAVLDLGCGTGAVGIYCAALGASRVDLTDGSDELLELALHNWRCNANVGLATQASVDVRLLRWGIDASPSCGYDLIVGSDVIYEAANHEPLCTTLNKLLLASPACRLVLATMPRQRVLVPTEDGDDDDQAGSFTDGALLSFARVAAAHGLRVCAPSSDGDDDVSLLPKALRWSATEWANLDPFVFEVKRAAVNSSIAPRSNFTTGFFDPASRAAGETIPDEVTVSAIDIATDASFTNSLHPQLSFGRFDLWPKLTQAIALLDKTRSEELAQVCERGALLFLREVLLKHSIGVPLFEEWPAPETTPRICERFGEGYAPFCHTDLRMANASMYNIWIPVSDTVATEPLLIFAAAPDGSASWRKPSDTACHLPPTCANEGDWYHTASLRRGQALIFPGDGGDGERGIFHASAAPDGEGTRASFDCREFVNTLEHYVKGPAVDLTMLSVRAADRLADDRKAWEAEVATT